MTEKDKEIQRKCEIVDFMLSHGGTYQVGRDGLIYRVELPEPVFKGAKTYVIPALYDEEEIHENCTVQVLRNSVTGEVSVGWWENA